MSVAMGDFVLLDFEAFKSGEFKNTKEKNPNKHI